ncbi:cation:proton antiporter [Clostridium swellfunianum]|uniref:cation:proton antiporter n=1 Tax=Clostridium swellfunianum TaxID=1367462 RepID=UPI00202F7A75|nr:cation:proton antiporter [Clostridium swellfunianum]MCM0650966.1 cation:proton antiporter [Clostridium swellfunianum]
MISINFLLDIAIILLSTKALGLITKKVHMPQVVGALLAGIIFGPAMLNLVHETEFISNLSELGVIVLMFAAGIETDIKELKKCGKASFIIALIGVIVPLLGGYIVASVYTGDWGISNLASPAFLRNVFIGVILTATSVSITVETLQELGKLKTSSGTAIMGAAVIDDIMGIVILTIITGTADSNVNLAVVLLKIAAFFVFAGICGFIFYKAFNWLCITQGQKRRIPIMAFVFCLLLAFISEEWFGVADITGAYAAGIVLANTIHSKYISQKFEVVSYMLLSPIFFAAVGLKITVTSMDKNMIIFTGVLLLVAVLTKVIGCGLGAKMCGYSKDESLKIGIGMISRGEVALIVANKGASVGLMEDKFFAPIILIVIITTLVTPILLKIVYSKKNYKHNEPTGIAI